MTRKSHTNGPLHSLLPAILATLLLAAAACDSADCPIQNRVYTAYSVIGADEQADTLRDTITVFTHKKDGKDTILYNMGYNLAAFNLPISYISSEDTLYFHQWRGTFDCTDTVRIAKTNTPHFESVECSATFFHTITSVVSTHYGIDTIIINNKNVNYDATKKHFRIRFKARD